MTPTEQPDLVERTARALTKAQREALFRCQSTALGAVIPSNDDDAKILHLAGLSWTHAHWWRQLNADGLAVRSHLIALAAQREDARS